VADDLFFEVATPLGFSVRVTHDYWELIVTIKHPVMRGREADVQHALREPDEIRRSRNDPTVHPLLSKRASTALDLRCCQAARWRRLFDYDISDGCY